MAADKNEDFWNTSASSTFNFDDEDDYLHYQSQILHPIVPEKNIVPIHSIISNQSLNLILDDIQSTNAYVSVPVDETVRKMSLGYHIAFHSMYQMLEEKLSLLDCSLETCDGNVIICVILFLRKTLKQNIFLMHLAKRKLAVKYYANYLISQNNLNDLGDLYMATGNINNTKELYYLISKNVSINQQNMLKTLEQFTIDYNLPSLNSHEAKFDFYQNLEFIQWQKSNKHLTGANSIIEQLALLCQNEWSKNKPNDETINEFKKQFKINESQFDWTIMNVLAAMKLWDKLVQLFTKSNWLKQNAFKSSLRSELFIIGLNKHKPPKQILEQFLQCFTDTSESLVIAQKLECHQFVINYFINQKDRLSLIDYKLKVPQISDEFSMIDDALRIHDKKWKN